MKGKIGVQQGEKRGQYNTPGTKQIKIKLDVYKELEKIEGSSFSEKISNILNKINKKGWLN